MGHRIGESLVERVSRDTPRFKSELDAVIFICKTFWVHAFAKQIDNLKTNHQVSLTHHYGAAETRSYTSSAVRYVTLYQTLFPLFKNHQTLDFKLLQFHTWNFQTVRMEFLNSHLIIFIHFFF